MSKFKRKMKLVSRFAILLSACLFISLFSCRGPQNTKNKVRSKIVSIQYERYGRVPDSAWTKIDDLTFIHTKNDFEYNSNEIYAEEGKKGHYTYIPASEVLISHPVEERKMRSDVNTNMMISNIAKFLIKNPNYEGTYEIVNPEKYVLSDELVIKRIDGKNIKVETSTNNIVILKALSEKEVSG